jgi:type I restriction enzyme, S subunit
MAGNGAELTLADLVTLQRGTTYKSALLGQPGPVLLGLASIQRNGGFRNDNLKTYGGDSPDKLTLRPGDIYVSLKDVTQSADLLGAIARVPPHIRTGRVTQDTVKLTFVRDDVPSRYVYWLLRTPVYREYCRAHAIGTTNLSIAREDFLAFPVPRPSARELTLVDTLDAVDDKIELNRRMNATLEAMARTLFQSWFVDFDPVRAKLDGREPAGLDPATAALFPNEFEDSELGPIPKRWEVKTIEELAERVAMGPFGSDIKVSTFQPEGVPVVSGQHLRGTLLNDSAFNFVTLEHADRLKRSNVQRGDVIFTHAGSIGQVAYIPETSRYQRYIISQRQFYMRCNRSVISPFYIASYFKTPEGQHRLLANTSSTGVPSISRPVTYLRQLKMIVPPPALLNIFDETVSAIHLKLADNYQQSRTFATLRDALLPKLLSGQLSVATATAAA